ncbi:SCO3374 family protein [Streptomyces sp. TG1A-8]|uniref:SCO3374 family protein n=1 Tax=Streptomyces sp. TG1A-8 TaxID=3051385 RepID=UPI00265C72FD|nr:SCO3374 family protein [Streptomyces sp. TG1A-8]MDO0926428.1 SCO3374 family protein [Streptomyces sp. TG1A-8]
MAGPVPTTSAVPLPQRPSGPGPSGRPDGPDGGRPGPDAPARHWYENVLGWPTVPGRPLRLATGVRFDVLDVPAEAGAAALGHLAPGSPVALCGNRMRLLVAAGSAEELPGMLDWLEWGALALDLRAVGAGGATRAPVPPGWGPAGPSPLPGRRHEEGAGNGRAGSVQGAAVWLRPPAPGCGAGAPLPALPAVGCPGGAPDLVRVVDTVAARCHRIRLRRANTRPPAGRRDQPLAFS